MKFMNDRNSVFVPFIVSYFKVPIPTYSLPLRSRNG